MEENLEACNQTNLETSVETNMETKMGIYYILYIYYTIYYIPTLKYAASRHLDKKLRRSPSFEQ